jgi:deoxyribodipyrimidine photo-lyase
VEKKYLRDKNISLCVMMGYSYDTLPDFIEKNKVGAVINDFNPLRCHQQWVTKTAGLLDEMGVKVYRVDGHNTVPMWIASDKLEYGACTIRNKIHKYLPTYLREYPAFTPPAQQSSLSLPPPVDWKAVDASLQIDRTVKNVD